MAFSSRNEVPRCPLNDNKRLVEKLSYKGAQYFTIIRRNNLWKFIFLSIEESWKESTVLVIIAKEEIDTRIEDEYRDVTVGAQEAVIVGKYI